MKRLFRRLTPPLLTLLIALPCRAQNVGDQVRVRLQPDQDWVTGTLIDLTADNVLAMRESIQLPLQEFQLGEISRGEWFKANNPALMALGGIAGGVAAQLISPCSPAEGTCLTSSKNGDTALWAGLGLVSGLVLHLITPGSWKKWIEDGLIVP